MLFLFLLFFLLLQGTQKERMMHKLTMEDGTRVKRRPATMTKKEKNQVMTGSSWRQFWNQDELFKALKALPDGSEVRLFAFQLNSEGSMVYVLAKPELVGGVALGFKTLPGGGGEFPFAKYCFEHFGLHDLPMILYADCEYDVPMNPGRDAAAMVEILIRYVRRLCIELFEANEIPNAKGRAERLRIHVETSHRPDVKMSVHLKIPQVVVRDMAAQLAFWSRLQAIFQEEQQQGVEDARQMVVTDKNGTPRSFVDMSVYIKQQGQLFRTLGATKNEREKELHFLVPEGRVRSSITLEEWLRSLVLRPHAKKGVTIPETWYQKETIHHRQPQSSSSSSSSSSSLTRVSMIPQEVGTKLFAFIDPQWKVPPGNLRIMSHAPQMTKTDPPITTQTFVVVQTGRSFYCPFKKGDHGSTAAYLIVRVEKGHEPSDTRCFCKVTCQSHH